MTLAAQRTMPIFDMLNATIHDLIDSRERSHLATNRHQRRHTRRGRDLSTHNDTMPPSLPPCVYPRDITELENTRLRDARCDHCNGSAAPTCDADAPVVGWDLMEIRIVCRDCVDIHTRCA